MKLAALVSGGKDSIYALYRAMKENEVVKLISIESVQDSMFFHRQNLELVKLQAEALELPLEYVKTGETKELDALEESIGGLKDEVDGVVSGAIASNYQRKGIEKICDKFGLESITPLWHADEEEMMEDLIEEGFEVMITKVAAQGLDESWLGRELDKDTLEELKEIKREYAIHPSGEGGEFETLVTDAPIFRKRMEITASERVWDEKTKSGFLKIQGRLTEK